MEVRDLFYNVPARRKFLKSDGAEAGHISRAVTQLALGFHEIGFTLVSGPRTLVDCAPAASLAERFQQIYGERPDLVEVRKDAAGIRLSGFAAALAGEAPKNGPQHLFVNRRAVRDKTIAHAIGEAYRRATIKPRRPEAHLFLEMPPERVDVNVHPAKNEVRFLEQSLVHEVVRRALGEALGQDVVPQVPLERPAPVAPEPRAQSIPGVLGGLGAASRWGPVTDAFRRRAPGEDGRDTVREGRAPEAAEPPAASDLSAMGTGPLIPLGQCRDTFIIAVDNDGIVIVDQHVAHERILFEQVMRRLTEGPVQSQRLLDPLVITLPPAGRAALETHAADLARLGFEIAPFGGDSVQVAAVPSLLDRAESESPPPPPATLPSAIRGLAEDLEGLERGTGAAAALGQIAATTACHVPPSRRTTGSPWRSRRSRRGCRGCSGSCSAPPTRRSARTGARCCWRPAGAGGVDDRLPGAVAAVGAEGVRPGHRRDRPVERYGQQRRWGAVPRGHGAGDVRRHEVALGIDGAQQLRRVNGHVDVRRCGREIGGLPPDQIGAPARRRRLQRISVREQRQLVRDAFHDGAAQIGRPAQTAGRAAGQQRLRGAAAPGRVEHVRAVGGPWQADAQLGRQRRQEVDGFHVGVHGHALALSRPLDEQRHRRDVRERGLGGLQEGEAGPQARPVVRRDGQQRSYTPAARRRATSAPMTVAYSPPPRLAA